jgi:nickel/cobalt exporter
MDPIHLAQSGSSNPVFFLAVALVLGALHGFEPGHSKGIMTAFIIGTRSSMGQAVVLAACVTLSHTLIVWILVLPASYGGALLPSLTFSPVLNLISGCIILGLSWWMLRGFSPHRHASDHHHEHLRPDSKHHHEHTVHGSGHHHEHLSLEPDGHGGTPEELENEKLLLNVEPDAHARYHMRQTVETFSQKGTSTGQIAIFGLSSGLAPCSAAIVLLITCLQLHQPWLGIALVAAFSLGLGMSLTAVALVASWAVRTIGTRMVGFQTILEKAPFLSALITAAVGFYLIAQYFRS